MSKAYDKINNLCCLSSNRYKDFFQDYDGTDEDFCKDIYEMVDCLSDLEKRDRVLDIIIEKNVDVCFIMNGYSLQEYNKRHSIDLLKEEFDLLKEVLESEKQRNKNTNKVF